MSSSDANEVTIVEDFTRSRAGITADHRNRYQFSGSSLDIDEEEGNRSAIEVCLQIVSFTILILTFPFSLLFMVRIVNEFERLVLFRFGRITTSSPKGPGFHILLPWIDYSSKVDLRIYNFIVPIKEIVLSDSVCITIEAVVWAKVYSVISAVTCTEDYYYSTKCYAAAVVRKVLGSHKLSDVVNDSKFLISSEIRRKINEMTIRIGVRCERIDLKNISLPEQLQRVMAREGIASRESKAMSLFADGELAASGHLTAASGNMDQTALSLRYMHTLISIQSNTDQGSTVLFPVPIDFGMWTFAESSATSSGLNRGKDGGHSVKELARIVGDDEELKKYADEILSESVLTAKDIFREEGNFNSREGKINSREGKINSEEGKENVDGRREGRKSGRKPRVDHEYFDIVTVHEVPPSSA